MLGETFGDMTCLNNVEKTESNSNEPTSSLFDEVMQAFTEIYSETDAISIDRNQFSSDEIKGKQKIILGKKNLHF